MSIRSRLDRLQRQMRTNGQRCPECPGFLFLHEDDDGTLRDEQGNVVPDDALTCKVCGGPGPGPMRFIILGRAKPREDDAGAISP